MEDLELNKIKAIYEAINKILQFTKDMVSIEELESNLMAWDAVKMNLVVIDEMDSKIDAEIKEHYNSVDWHKIKEAKPYVNSKYLGFDIEEIWLVIKEKMPDFKLQLERVLV
ncbi:MAG: DUF86 domain-containing protein [Bacteroidales bacterium]|nr:DUF86 domain-containing protein [Bacteroidales bacterium]MBN2758657.1 DUF86 domain-containing protein [Bacteroidales bacterium]